MSKFTTETINASEGFQWPPKPRYHAVEVDGEPDVFQCPAKDDLFWSSSQLREWAGQVDCELILLRWNGGDENNPA
jgi:hypothetical protein